MRPQNTTPTRSDPQKPHGATSAVLTTAIKSVTPELCRLRIRLLADHFFPFILLSIISAMTNTIAAKGNIKRARCCISTDGKEVMPSELSRQLGNPDIKPAINITKAKMQIISLFRLMGVHGI